MIDWTPSGHNIEQLGQSYKYYNVSYVIDWTPSGHNIEQLGQSYKYYNVSYVIVIKVFHCTDYCFSVMSVK